MTIIMVGHQDKCRRRHRRCHHRRLQRRITVTAMIRCVHHHHIAVICPVTTSVMRIQMAAQLCEPLVLTSSIFHSLVASVIFTLFYVFSYVQF